MTKNCKIALGAWAWGEGISKDNVFGNSTTVSDLKPVFDKACELGLNLWDTALVYGMGASEKILGEFIKDKNRNDFIISTKFTPQLAGMFKNDMQVMLDASKANLHTDVIDIYWIHNPVGITTWASKIIPLAKSGQIKQIGVSNHNLKELKYVNEVLAQEGLKVSAIQNHYSLLNRTSEEGGLLDYCVNNNITFYSYMVLEQGALSGKYDVAHPFKEGSDRANSYNAILPALEPLLALMKDLASKYNANPAEIATAWAIAKHTLPIVGVTKPQHVVDAYHAMQIELTSDEIHALEDLASKVDVNTIRGWEKAMN